MYYQQVGEVCLGANRFCQVLPAGKNNYGLKVRLLCALNQTCLWALKHNAKLNRAKIQNIMRMGFAKQQWCFFASRK